MSLLIKRGWEEYSQPHGLPFFLRRLFRFIKTFREPSLGNNQFSLSYLHPAISINRIRYLHKRINRGTLVILKPNKFPFLPLCPGTIQSLESRTISKHAVSLHYATIVEFMSESLVIKTLTVPLVVTCEVVTVPRRYLFAPFGILV